MDTPLEVADAPADAPEVEAEVEAPEAPDVETPETEDLTRSAAEIAADELERVRSAEPSAPEDQDADADQEKPRLKAQFGLSRNGEEVDLDDGLLGLEFKYKASGEEHTKSLDELVRTAQSAHGTAQKLEQYRTERKELSDALLEKESLAEALAQDRDLFVKVLKDSSGEQFKALQAEYLKRAGQPAPDAAPDAPDASTDQDIQAGQQVLEQHIMPYAERLAEAYEGADATEIVEQVLLELSEEPPQYLTADTVGEILNERIVQALEEAGYEASGDRPTFDLSVFEDAGAPASRGIRPRSERSSNGNSDLAKENQRLREQLEAAKQGKQRAKLDAAPPAAGSSGPSGIQDGEPILDLKGADTLDEMKRRLQSLQGR